MKASFPLLLAALFSVLMPSDAMAQRDGFGIGIIAGDPTGLCIKNWLSQKSALEMAAAWSFEGNGGFFLSGDYVLHSFGISGGSGLMLTYGLGGRLYFRDGDKNNDGDTFLGLRVPWGSAIRSRGSGRHIPAARPGHGPHPGNRTQTERRSRGQALPLARQPDPEVAGGISGVARHVDAELPES